MLSLMLKITTLLRLLLLPISLISANTARIPIPEPLPSPAAAAPGHSLTFFMHDILGGSAPSDRVVAGITAANTQTNSLPPFAKHNVGVFPITGGIPLVTSNNGGINAKNTGFIKNSNFPLINNNGNALGRITVIDDELSEGQELGSSVIGKAQGFYLASSLDGSSQTMAFTAIFDEEEEEESVSFFGVHRTAAVESQIAVVGGTRKYGNAKGYATVETLHLGDQHVTDGVETLLQINVHLTL